MAKVRVSRDFSRNNYNDKALGVKVAHIIECMTGNDHFPEPNPPLATLSECNARFSDAVVSTQMGNRFDTARKNSIREELVTMIRLEALYLEQVSNGDESIILGSGFNVVKRGSAVGALDKPEGLKIRITGIRNSIELVWSPVKHAKFYEVMHTEAPAIDSSTWQVATCTKCKLKIDNLTSGKEYVFKVAAAGTNLARVWSNDINSYVL